MCSAGLHLELEMKNVMCLACASWKFGSVHLGVPCKREFLLCGLLSFAMISVEGKLPRIGGDLRGITLIQ